MLNVVSLLGPLDYKLCSIYPHFWQCQGMILFYLYAFLQTSQAKYLYRLILAVDFDCCITSTTYLRQSLPRRLPQFPVNPQ